MEPERTAQGLWFSVVILVRWAWKIHWQSGFRWSGGVIGSGRNAAGWPIAVIVNGIESGRGIPHCGWCPTYTSGCCSV